MSSEWPGTAVAGLPSRRSACDRCRGQKLRCLREGSDPERCERCVRSNSECVTSPSFRMGRPPRNESGVADRGHDTSPPTKRRRQQHQRRPRQDSDSNASLLTPAPEDVDKGERSQQPLDLTTLFPPRPASISSPESGSLANPAWLTSRQDWQMPIPCSSTADVMQVDYIESLNAHNTANSSMTMSNATNSMLWSPHDNPNMYDLMYPNNLDLSFMNFEASMDSGDNSGQPSNLFVPTPAALTTSMPFSNGEVLPSIPTSTTAPTENYEDEGLMESVSDANVAQMGLSGNTVGPAGPGDDPNNQKKHQEKSSREGCIQRLSILSLKLSTLLSSIDAGAPTITLDNLISPIDEHASQKSTPVDEILNNTREFLEIIDALIVSSRSSGATSLVDTGASPSDFNHSAQGSRSYASSSASTDSSAVYSPLNSFPTTPFSGHSSHSARSISGADVHLDTAALLPILTCYINIIRLYVVVFTHFHVFLTEIASSDDPWLCPVLELSFSQFPLQSGNLQAMILIQIVTHLLEKIEKVLGLPAEYRLNKTGDPQPGLLSDEDFAKMVKIVIRKEEIGSPENGKGGMKTLRKHIKRAKQLLKKSIAA